jgi:hypothetical protein
MGRCHRRTVRSELYTWRVLAREAHDVRPEETRHAGRDADVQRVAAIRPASRNVDTAGGRPPLKVVHQSRFSRFQTRECQCGQ